jgi:hypothetical protein
VVGACTVAAAVAGLHVVLVVALLLLTLLWVSNALLATGHGHLFKFAANTLRRLRKGDSAS